MVNQFIQAATGNYAPRRYGYGKLWKPELIVIHTSVGSMGSLINTFKNPINKVSAHYGIGLDGYTVKFVRDSGAAFHAGVMYNPSNPIVQFYRGNPNLYSFGIELVDNGNPNIVRPPAQLYRLVTIVTQLCKAYGIDPSEETIAPHSAVRATKTCPGSVPVASIIKQVQSRMG